MTTTTTTATTTARTPTASPSRGRRALIHAGASAVLAWVVILGPRVATACAVCSAGRDEENQLAFLLSTIFMSVLPLIVIGSVVFVLWRRIRRLESDKTAMALTGAGESISAGAPARR